MTVFPNNWPFVEWILWLGLTTCCTMEGWHPRPWWSSNSSPHQSFRYVPQSGDRDQTADMSSATPNVCGSCSSVNVWLPHSKATATGEHACLEKFLTFLILCHVHLYLKLDRYQITFVYYWPVPFSWPDMTCSVTWPVKGGDACAYADDHICAVNACVGVSGCGCGWVLWLKFYNQCIHTTITITAQSNQLQL